MDTETGQCVIFPDDAFEGEPLKQVTLPENWDELTAAEKIALNPYNCPEPTNIRADNGRCISINGAGPTPEEEPPIEYA